MVYLYIFVIVALAAIEGRPLIRDKKWAELAVFSLLTVAGATVVAMNTVAFEPYRISALINFIFQPYTSFIINLLTGF